MDLLFRRRQLFESQSFDNYIRDGLVLWLDGIEKGNNSDAWTDKINNHIFTNNGCVFKDNCVEFTNGKLTNTSFVAPSSNSGTIELVFYCDDSIAAQVIFMPKSGQSGIGFGMFSDDRVYINAVTSTPKRYPWNVVKPTVISSVSLSNSRGYVNGVSKSKYSTPDSYNTYLAYADSYNNIGNREPGHAAQFVGSLYSLRIYNRILTQNEILHNYTIDKARFNL